MAVENSAHREEAYAAAWVEQLGQLRQVQACEQRLCGVHGVTLPSSLLLLVCGFRYVKLSSGKDFAQLREVEMQALCPSIAIIWLAILSVMRHVCVYTSASCCSPAHLSEARCSADYSSATSLRCCCSC